MIRLSPADVGAWLLKTTRPPAAIDPDWTAAGDARDLVRCVRRSYRLTLVRPGQPCLLWLSGRTDPGVHALGVVTGEVVEDGEDGPRLPVRFTLLADPVPRADLLADPSVRDAEVLRMPAGSNPSWLSPLQYAAVLAHAGVAPASQPGLGPWRP
ncbi:hypothetical protein [Blastococcus sp. SYSU D00820]